MINDGRYSLIYQDGQYRTVWVKTPKNGSLQGKQILKIKVGHDYEGVGFLTPNGKVNFWSKFRAANKPERLSRIQQAVDRIMADPDQAGLSYAMKENRCYRCNKELTVPASIHRGMGPECANRAVTRKANQEAYQARAAATKKDNEPVQRNLDDEWIQQKNRFAEEERKQEERAFRSDPDYQSWGGKFSVERPDLPAFENQRCGICGVPRYRCSC